MPKFRKLYTKTLDSYDFTEMPNDFIRVVWLLLTLISDSEGRGIYNMAWVKSKMFPLRPDVEICQLEEAFTWLSNRKMITIYSVNNREYFYIPTFKKYQTGTEKEATSVLPEPENYSRLSQDLLKTKSRTTTDLLSVAESVVVSESEFGSEFGENQNKNGNGNETTVKQECNDDVTFRHTVDNNSLSTVFKAYENEIGILTAAVRDRILDCGNDYPAPWIVEAIKESALKNKRFWGYTEGILKRWKVDGRSSASGIKKVDMAGKIGIVDGVEMFIPDKEPF